MMLNMVTRTVAAHPSFESVVRLAMTVPRDEQAARAALRGLADALHTLRETGNKQRLPHPNRIPQLFSALWQVQAPETWPTYYKSARDALDETDVIAPSEDPIESYLAFRGPYQQLATELGIPILELEQLCRLQQTAADGADADVDTDGNVAAWLFQCRPDTYDLRSAVQELTDLTWAIRTHRRRIHKGDTVYLWESGADAALIAVGTITSEPTMLPEEPAARRFYVTPTADVSESLRVRLHLDRVLRPPLTRRQILAAPELADVQVFRSAQGTNFKLSSSLVEAIEEILAQQAREPERRYWKIAPGSDAREWPTMERESVIAVWNEQNVGDLRSFASKSEFEQRYTSMYPEISERKRRSRIDQLWAFREIAVGDVIIANRGFSKVVGEGIVTGGYFHRPDHPFPHARPVRWERTDVREIEDQGPRWRPTVVPLTAAQYDSLFDDDDDDDVEPEMLPKPPQGSGSVPNPAPSYTLQDALKQVFLSHAELARLVELLQYKKNLVLQGPPGVGKTFVAAELAYVLLGSKDDSRIKRVQFHQSYAYEDFVRGYRPVDGGFAYRDGPMFTFCEQARRDDRPHVMIIDEINRGNLSKILGELMLLIEPDKREPRWHVELAYAKPGEPPFWVPPNVYIIGTMNTADRSIALVDYALRRRFVFAPVPPAFGLGGFEQFLEGKGVAAALRTKIVTRISELNAAIEKDTRNLGRGYVIGHSYFCQGDPRETYDEAWYERIVKFEIEPLLDEYWAESPEKVKSAVAALLGP